MQIDYFGETRVISLQDIQEIAISIKEQINKEYIHPYLAKHFQTPSIDDDKLLLLISVLDQLELSLGQIQNYAISMLLIQIALDIHDFVPNENERNTDKSSRTAQQLMVLAGDYYSGLYYKLLASSKDIAVVQAFARGIKKINEHKVSLFHQEFSDIESLFASIKTIESSLLIQITGLFNAGYWNETIESLLLVNRLIAERQKYIQTGTSILFSGIKAVMFPNQQSDFDNAQRQSLLSVCDRYIELSKQKLKDGIKKLPKMNELLRGRIMAVFSGHQPVGNNFVEEG